MEGYILDLFEKLNKEIVKYNPYYSKDLINKAFLYAYEAHKNQYRKSKELYITHPLHTALNLTRLEADDISIVGALLHDVLDNKSYNIKDIEKNFGKEIRKIVLGVNKLGDLYYTTEMSKKDIEELKKSIILVGDDIRIFLIKIADRFHNLKTLDFLPKQKRYRIAKETEEIYLQIVNFLSIGEFLTEMHDLCFKYTNEIEYKKLKKIFGKKQKYNEQKIIEIHNIITKLFEKEKIEIVNIEGRVKSLYSIYNKMKIKNLSIDNIGDILALRIITKNLKDCYLVLGIIHNFFKVKFDRFKDYISSPKDNGYQSIHTTVFDENQELIEFQIQTEQMYKLNKTGLAAHFLYKGFGVDYKDLPDWMNKILDLQRKTINQKRFIQKIKDEIMISEIKCFNEDGKSIILPKDSVLIDFAFEVGIEEGIYFSEAYVNGVYTQDAFLKLKNGDYIKLKKGNEIKKDYFIENFFLIKTQKAREEIKNIFKKYSKKSLINLGKYMLNEALEGYFLKPFGIIPQRIKNEIIKLSGVKDEKQLYLFLGIGSIDINEIIKKINYFYKKENFKENINLKIYLKTQDFMSLNNILNLIYNLNIIIKKIKFYKNIIKLSLTLDSKNTFNNLILELKRLPNVLKIKKVYFTKLKILIIITISTFIFIILLIIGFIKNPNLFF